MKIRTRLILYNIIIVLTSVLLIFAAFQYIQLSSRRAMQEIEAVTAEDGTIYYVPTKHQDLEPQKPALPKSSLPEPFRRSYGDILIALAIVLAVIVALALLLSSNLLHHVFRPVKLLEDGAARVRAGHYATPIHYSAHDEFAPVIASFNSMQAELLDKTKKAAAYEAAKRTMVNGISHDLRTPLTVVKGHIKGIQDGIADTPQKRQEYLATAYARVEDIENLTAKLFETFNYETAEIQLDRTPTELGAFLAEIISSHEHVAAGRAIAAFDFPTDPLYATIDRTEFKRVFDNLIHNAVKYSGRHPVRLAVALRATPSNIAITFTDNGRGAPAKSLPYLFDEFYKADNSRSRDKASSGLGLFIVKKVIESHGGTIAVVNAPGLSFTITLPAEPDTATHDHSTSSRRHKHHRKES